MSKILPLLCFLFFCSQTTQAQTNKRINDAKFVLRPMIFIDYSFYHWYQEPPRIVDASPKNVGQVFNVLPGLGTGIIMGSKTKLLFSIEATVKYFPFSLDLAGYEGMGSLAFPVLANFRIPIGGFFFVQIGGGVQWTQINIHQRTAAHQAYANPFFMTYFGEIGGGIEENAYLLYFLRFGYNQNQATSFDLGLRVGLHGSLWE